MLGSTPELGKKDKLYGHMHDEYSSCRKGKSEVCSLRKWLQTRINCVPRVRTFFNDPRQHTRFFRKERRATSSYDAPRYGQNMKRISVLGALRFRTFSNGMGLRGKAEKVRLTLHSNTSVSHATICLEFRSRAFIYHSKVVIPIHPSGDVYESATKRKKQKKSLTPRLPPIFLLLPAFSFSVVSARSVGSFPIAKRSCLVQ